MTDDVRGSYAKEGAIFKLILTLNPITYGGKMKVFARAEFDPRLSQPIPLNVEVSPDTLPIRILNLQVPSYPTYFPKMGEVHVTIEGAREPLAPIELPSLRVLPESLMFAVMVQEVLGKLDFVCKSTWGKGPTIIAKHRLLPRRTIDVECPLTRNAYGVLQFEEDKKAFEVRKDSWTLTDLFLVPYAQRFSKKALGRRVQRNVSGILFGDLNHVTNEYEQARCSLNTALSVLMGQGLTTTNALHELPPIKEQFPDPLRIPIDL